MEPEEMSRIKRIREAFSEYVAEADDTGRFDGWESIGLFVARTLSEAWAIARPEDAGKFEDLEFKEYVDRASGKWLEPASPDDDVKILLAYDGKEANWKLVRRFVHELTHALVYRDATKEIPFSECHSGSKYFVDCSEFRAVYADTQYEVFCRLRERNAATPDELFECLSMVLGSRAADSVAGLLRAKADGDEHGMRYYIARFVGASRAIRDESIKYGNLSPVFQLWHMQPEAISEVCDGAFYLGNEWSECDLTINYEPGAPSFYRGFLKKLAEGGGFEIR